MTFSAINQTTITIALTVDEAIDIAQAAGADELHNILQEYADQTMVAPVDGGLNFFRTMSDYDTWAAQA